MESKPNFRVDAGELVLKASKKAAMVEKLHLSDVAKGVPFVPKEPEVVLGEARAKVIRGGGDPFDRLLLGSESAIQFGQYRGRTFRGLLENDLGYSLMILCGHQRERDAGRTDRGALMANKDAFLEYACAFEKVKESIKERRQREGTLPGRQDDCLVGYGDHRKNTYKELYEAKDKERKGYVQFLLNKHTKPGSRMDVLKKYIMQKEKEEERVNIGKRKASSSASQPAVLSPSRPASPPTQSSHSQPVTAHAAEDLTDDDLLAAATEMELQAMADHGGAQ